MFLLGILLTQTAHLTLDLAQKGHAVSPTLYGLMTEEINYSYDGGLYGEVVRNRVFKDNLDKPVHWTAVGGGATVTIDRNGGMSSALPAAIRVKGAVANDGYWGIPVRANTNYALTVCAKADAPGPITASLESSDGSTIYARTQVEGVTKNWQKLSATLSTAHVKTTQDTRLVITTGTSRTTTLCMVSLFQPTYKDRPNGNRSDLTKMLADMKPGFLRFPGGNYLEGSNFKDRFDWKKTLGPIEQRPGHMAPWSYRSTDGMGLLEFLHWCEDMNAKPVLGVFAGYVLRGDYVEAGTELTGFVQDALDEIEYIIGAPNTKWGAQRVKDGHPKPFTLEAVEIGNEDGFDMSGSYEGRFVQFYDAIKKKYPKLKVISSTGGKDWLGARFPITQRKPDMVDEHYYASTWDLMTMASKYDDYDRKGPKIFVGEWAAQDVPEPWANAGEKAPLRT
jgi:alpha-L-arabinofuranosidase